MFRFVDRRENPANEGSTVIIDFNASLTIQSTLQVFPQLGKKLWINRSSGIACGHDSPRSVGRDPRFRRSSIPVADSAIAVLHRPQPNNSCVNQL